MSKAHSSLKQAFTLLHEQEHSLSLQSSCPIPQGNEVAISVLGPCSDNLAELSWEEWKAVMLTQSDGTDGGGTQNEEEAGSKCFQQTCSPTAADRAQCPPGRFAY
eukprot:scaffold84356_cov15-Tisochrysis_lutea.AAC.1